MNDDQMAALVGGVGRGFTVLCLIDDAGLLAALMRLVGPTGLVIAAGAAVRAGGGWAEVRCDPARSIPVRSHVVDAAVLRATPDLALVAEEVRRALAPGGDVRVLLAGGVDAEVALTASAIRTLSRATAGVFICRGPG